MRSPQSLTARLLGLTIVALVALAPGVLGASDDSTGPDDPQFGSDGVTGELPPAALAIIRSEPYRHGQWSWHAVDLSTGEELLASDADVLTLLGSTTKVFTVGTYYDRIGPDDHLTTAVYAVGEVSDGVLDGDLVIVGAGDFILGSRAVSATDVEFQEPDHVYWYIGPVAHPVEADPLAGLDQLAAQVAAAGISSVAGDVLVDDRLWEPYPSKEGVVTSLTVNDNLLDVEVAPGKAVGDPAVLTVRPGTAYFEIVNEVTTVEAGDTIEAYVEAGDGHELIVRGEVSHGHDPFWTAYFAPDPSAYARALFVEALERAGVSVAAPLASASEQLPAGDAYDGRDPVATLDSPPAHVLGRLILKTSHNRGAETFMCLLAVSTGSTECIDGLAIMNETVRDVGIDEAATWLVDGEGSDPSSATPRAVTTWLAWADERPWAEAFRLGMPDIGDDGTINAKSGTSAAPYPLDGRVLINTKAQAGYIETDDGLVAISVYANGGLFDELLAGLEQSVADLNDVLVAIEEDL